MATAVLDSKFDLPSGAELAPSLVNDPKDVVNRLYRLQLAFFGCCDNDVCDHYTKTHLEYLDVVSDLFEAFMPQNLADGKDLLPAVDAGILEFFMHTFTRDAYFRKIDGIQHLHIWALTTLLARATRESLRFVAERAVKIAPVLFGGIWTHRTLLERSRPGGPVDTKAGDRKPLADLVGAYLRIYHMVTNASAPLNSCLFHVQLLLWLLSREQNIGSPVCLSVEFMDIFLDNSADSPKRSTPSALRHPGAVIDASVIDKSTCNTFVQECIIDGVGVKRFLSCYEEQFRRLASGQLPATEYMFTVGCLNPTFECKQLVPTFAQRDTLSLGIEAMKTMVKVGAEQASVAAWTWCVGAYEDIIMHVLDGFVDETGEDAITLPSLRPEVVDLFSCSVRLAACNIGSRPLLNGPSLTCLTRLLTDWFRLHKGSHRARPFKLDPVNAAGLRKVARPQWWPSLRELQTVCQTPRVTEDLSRLLTLWSDFGRVLGLDAAKERVRHERDARSHCSWVNCKYHAEDTPDVLLTCKGCGDARYCGRDCQMLDWKHGGHKQACRRLK